MSYNLKSDVQILLNALNINVTEKLIAIREDNNSDANFLITHLIKQILQDKDKSICLFIMRYPTDHYHSVGKRLHYTLSDKVKEECITILELLNMVTDDIDKEGTKKFLIADPEELVKNFYLTIEVQLHEMLQKRVGIVYLIIDDLSILLDLGLQVKQIMNLLNALVNYSERLNIIVNTHVSGLSDQILCNAVRYISDVLIDVESLKTGRSFYVSGAMSITRTNVPVDKYQFKLTDRGVKLFRPGQSVYNLSM